VILVVPLVLAFFEKNKSFVMKDHYEVLFKNELRKN